MFSTRQFAEIDTALRHGRHVSRHDYLAYEFLQQRFDELQGFYAAYQCKLVQHPDGFFYLLAVGDLVPSMRLPRSAMHLGQFLALKCRDPELTRSDGLISISALIADLETTIPAETLSRVYARRQKEVLSGERIHEEIRRALRLLIELQFVRQEGDDLVPLEAIARFYEMARHNNAPTDDVRLALAQRGALLTQAEEDDGTDGTGEGEGDDGQNQ